MSKPTIAAGIEEGASVNAARRSTSRSSADSESRRIAVLAVFRRRNHKEDAVARIVEGIGRPPKEIVDGFRGLLSHESPCSIPAPSLARRAEFRGLLSHESPACAVSDRMGRMGAMASSMRPLSEGVRFAGVAVTMKTLA